MNRTVLFRLAFAFALLAVVALSAMPAMAQPRPNKLIPSGWVGNCPVAFCSSNPSSNPVRTCHEVEAATNCERWCPVYIENGVECKFLCNYA